MIIQLIDHILTFGFLTQSKRSPQCVMENVCRSNSFVFCGLWNTGISNGHSKLILIFLPARKCWDVYYLDFLDVSYCILFSYTIWSRPISLASYCTCKSTHPSFLCSGTSADPPVAFSLLSSTVSPLFLLCQLPGLIFPLLFCLFTRECLQSFNFLRWRLPWRETPLETLWPITPQNLKNLLHSTFAICILIVFGWWLTWAPLGDPSVSLECPVGIRLSRRPNFLTETPFWDCSVLAVHQVWCRGYHFPLWVLPWKLLGLPMIDPEIAYGFQMCVQKPDFLFFIFLVSCLHLNIQKFQQTDVLF